MINKKGQSLSINTIIIALIAVTVLVVVIMIFTGSMGKWVKGLFGLQNQCCDKECTGATGLPTDWKTTVTKIDGIKTVGSCDANTEDQVFGRFLDVPQGYVCCKAKTA